MNHAPWTSRSLGAAKGLLIAGVAEQITNEERSAGVTWEAARQSLLVSVRGMARWWWLGDAHAGRALTDSALVRAGEAGTPPEAGHCPTALAPFLPRNVNYSQFPLVDDYFNTFRAQEERRR